MNLALRCKNLCKLLLGTGLVLVSFASSFAQDRIVAIGDVHGDLADFTLMLKKTGILDASGRWTGGDSVLVQTGDLLDRGPQDREVLDFIMRLQKEATKSKGRVISVLGNHEVMNLIGDLRYVHPDVYRSFTDAKSEQRRSRAWRQYQRFMQRRAERYQVPIESIALPEETWLQGHPLGYLEHREAFSARGSYGRWLRKRPVVVKLGELLFVHGGVTEQLPGTIDAINRRLQEELRQFDLLREYLVRSELILRFFDWQEAYAAVDRELKFLEAQYSSDPETQPDPQQQQHLELLKGYLQIEGWYLVHPLGPLWNRSLAQDPEDEFTRQRVQALTQKYGVEHIIVGHTPQLQGIRARFDGRVIIIDTGMLTSYYLGGTPSALLIEKGKLTAVYPDRQTPLFPAAPQATAQAR